MDNPLYVNWRTGQPTNIFQELIFQSSANVETARFTEGGQFVLGSPTSISAFGFESPLQLHGTNIDGISLFNWSNDATSQFIDYNKSRGTTIGAHVIVQNNDNLGIWDCAGSDGTQFIQSVTLRARVDGTPGTNDMPGRLEIRTTPDGGSSSIERVRISATGMASFWGTEIPTSTTSVSVTFSDTPIQGHVGQIATSVSAFMYWFNDNFGPSHNFIKSRGNSVNANTIVANGDRLGEIIFSGADGTNFINAARIRVLVDGTPGTNDMPGRILFMTTPDGTAAVVERMRISNGGNTYFPGVGTTASAANAFLDSGSTPANELLRSTSSRQYKRDIENIDDSYADNVLKLRPVWYRSAIPTDKQDWSHYGLIAEEVAEIEPRLVQYGYKKEDWEHIQVDDDKGGKDIITRLKSNAQPTPDGVAYDRLPVLLLNIIQRQQKRIEKLETEINSIATLREQVAILQEQMQALQQRA